MPPEILPLLPYITAIATLVSGGVTWVFKVLVEKRIESMTHRSIAGFQHSLDAVSRAAEFDYQRRLTDFNLFIEKKHAVIAQLYELAVDANSQILNAASGDRSIPVLHDTNEEDADAYLRDHAGVPAGKRAEILGLWESDRLRALEVLDSYQSEMQVELARRALVKANNFRIRSDLYLPDAISSAAIEVTSGLSSLLQSINEGTATNLVVDSEYMHRLTRLRILMKAEMARSELPAPRGSTPDVQQLKRE